METGSTREMFRKNQAFEAVEATRIARMAARVLVEIHGKGYCHGNLKPSNLFIEADGEIRVADFSIPPPAAQGSSAAPVPDAATDIRLLGATYHWLLTGKPPRDISGRSIASSNVVVPEACQRIVERAMSRKSASTYRTAAEMEAALADAEANLHGLAAVESGFHPRRAKNGASLGDLIVIPNALRPRKIEIGKVLGGKYLITELIGQGSSGIVYGPGTKP